MKTEQLRAIAEVSRIIASELDVDRLLQRVAELLHKRFGYPFVHIFEVHRFRRWIEFKTGQGLYADYLKEELSFKLDDERGIIAWAARNGKAVLVNNVYQDERFQPLSLPGIDIKSEMAVPLVFGGDVLGVFDVESEAFDAFTADDQWLLETLAANIAVALRNAILYRSERWRRQAADGLRRVAGVLRSKGSLNTVLATILKQLGDLLPLTYAAIWLKTESGYRFKIGHRLGRRTPPAGEITNPWFDRIVSSASALVRQSEDALAPLAEDCPANHSALGVALESDGNVLGVLTLVHRQPRRYGLEAANLAEIFAGQAAVVIENAQLYAQSLRQKQLERELELARDIQTSFIPDELPALPGWETAACWKMAREVGGDFFDLIPLPDNRLLLVIADVADKGLPAALFMARTSSFFRAVALDCREPAHILNRVNRLLTENTEQTMFVSAFCAVLNLENGQLHYASAGHNPPLLLNNAGDITALRTKGMVLGVLNTARFQQKSLTLSPGNALLLYTDGVTEAFNPHDEAFGEDRLRQALAASRHFSAQKAVNAIHRRVRDFTRPHPQSDDFTLLLLRRQK